MYYSLLEARAHKKGFVAAAGKDYRDANSQIVERLISEGKPAFLGMQQGDGLYTILGQSACHLMTTDNEEVSIDYDHFLSALKENAMQKGKKADFEFLHLDGVGSLWLKNGQAMSSIWGLIKFITLPRRETKPTF